MRSGFSGRNGSAVIALFADQHFDARLRLFELFAAGVAQAHAALEKFQGAFQREIAAFQFLDHLFEFIEAGLEDWYRLRIRRLSAIASF